MSTQSWLGGLLAGGGLVMTIGFGPALGWGAWSALFLIPLFIGLFISVRASVASAKKAK